MKNLVKVEKRIVVFPQKFKSVTLTVTDAESFKEADELLIHEVSRYLDLLEQEDIEILKRTIGLVLYDRQN